MEPGHLVAEGQVGDQRPRHPVRRISLTLGAVFAMTMAVLVGRNLTRDAESANSPLLGKPAPSFSLRRLDAVGTVESSRLRGQVVIVNFWATWCVPCRRENANLDQFYQRWHHRGLELIGILFNDTPGAARQFRKELGGTWPLAEDPTDATGFNFGITGVPETFIIDENGIVVARLIGAVGPTTLDDVLTQLANGTPTVTYRNDGGYRPN